MSQKTANDFIPFKYEPLRRADRIAERPNEQDIAQQQADALRLLRSPGNPRDNTLSKVAEEWRTRLSPHFRTSTLCERYPRIANRIALCWSDPVLTLTLLDQLLRDRRGGRKGFAAPVHAELVALAAAVRNYVTTVAS
jgi:hypothetical protein